MGRAFVEEENQPGKDRVVLLTHSLWQRRFGGDPNIVNKTITLNGISRTVIGVMPPRFNYPKGAELYAPLAITPEIAKDRTFRTCLVVGRLKPGITIGGAQSDLDTIAARLEKQYPEDNAGLGVAVFPILADTVRQYQTALWIMMAAVGFVLLIACANVANLMLARASGRQKEIALRAALGANRWRIIRQLLTESLIVALIGGALGVLVAFWGIDLLRVGNPGEAAKYAPGWDRLGINLPVLLFTVGLSLISGLVFGLAPALQVSKPDLNNALKEGNRQSSGSSPRRGSLVVLGCASVICWWVLVCWAVSLTHENESGFNADSVLTMSLFGGEVQGRTNAATFIPTG